MTMDRQPEVLPGWRSSSGARWSYRLLMSVIFLAIFGPWIANEKPYYCKLEGQAYFPLFSGMTEAVLSNKHPAMAPVSWHLTRFESIWRAPIPYSHTTIDLAPGTSLSPLGRQDIPLRMRHWLGTDAIGRDVLAGMIRGCRVSLLIGLGSMILALLIGLPLGAVAAYWGNTEKRISRIMLVLLLVLAVLVVWVFLFPWPWIWRCITGFLLLAGGLLWILHSGKKARRQVPLPVDQGVMGLVSVIDGFPAMFLILILIAILPMKGWLMIMLIIAMLRWPAVARYMRAEVFRMKETNYIKAARLANFSSWHILVKQVIPFAFRPVMVSFIFGVATAILAESSLSFLGIGLPTEEINWGRLLAQSRNHFEAWWLVVFPGFALFFTLVSLYTIGNAVDKKVNA